MLQFLNQVFRMFSETNRFGPITMQTTFLILEHMELLTCDSTICDFNLSIESKNKPSLKWPTTEYIYLP